MGAAAHWQACLCLVALTTGSRSFAAAANPPEEEVAPAVVITGTRIPRADLTAVSPVTTISGEEFRIEGATNAEEVLNQLPQVNPSQGEFVSAGSPGIATVDLRGLGSVRTLVLVNGHRLMPGDPRFPVADINGVPTSLIQRVEVLTGGAAAVYGSDAVAGVVNFILDTRLSGLKFAGQVGAFQHDNRDRFVRGLLDPRGIPYPTESVLDGRRVTLSAAFGRGFLDGRAHLTLYAGFRGIAAVRQNQRDYGSCPITARIGSDGSPVLECGGPLVSYPGNYFDNLGNSYQVTPDRTFVPGLNRFNYARWNLYQRPDKRFTAGGIASFDPSSSLQLYAEAMAMKDRTSWQIGPSGDFRDTQTINCDNPLLSDQQRALICRTGNFVGETADVDENGTVTSVTGSPTPFVDPVTGATYKRAWLLISRRNIEGGSIRDDIEHKSIRLLVGAKGKFARGVTYDASYLFGRVSLDRRYHNNLSISRLGKALDIVSDPSTGQPVCRSVLIARDLGTSEPGADANCVPWDVFATGQVTPQSVAYLAIPPSMSGWFSEQVANANATIELDQWGIGSPWSDEGAAINLGAEFRKDTVSFDPDEFAETGDIAGFGEQVFPIRGSVRTREIFGEARIPLVTDRLVRRLAFEGGFRRSWYTNSRSSFSSDTYKLALDLTAVGGLRLRASQQGANRAPNVLELLAPVQSDSFGRDPCAGVVPLASQAQCALTGVSAAQYGHVSVPNSNLIEFKAVTGGNEDLRAENATTRSVGVVVEPRFLRGFNATIDWWDIKLKGAISKIGAQAIVDSCVASGDPIFCNRIHRDANGSLWLTEGYVDNRLANLGSLRVRGIDGSANYTMALGRLGSVNFGFRGSYVLRWMVDNGGLSKPFDCAGLFGEPCGMQPRWKHSTRVTWNSPGSTSLSLQWRHLSGVKLAALDPGFNQIDAINLANQRLRPHDYLDATAAVRLQKRFEFRVGVNNLFDRQPPLVVSNTAAGGGPYNANTYPEWYDPLGRYIFASLAVELER